MATKITVNNNGSLKIEGEIEIYDGAGNNTTWQVARSSVSAVAARATTNHSATDRTLAVGSSRRVATVLPAPKPKP